MKRFFVVLAILLLTPSIAFSAGANRRSQGVLSSTKGVTIAIPDTDTVYTHSFPINEIHPSEDLGVMFLASPATADAVIYLEQSYQKPTTEGSADTSYVETTTVSSVVGAVWQMATVDTVTMTYGRFKIVGKGSNGANSTIQIKIAK